MGWLFSNRMILSNYPPHHQISQNEIKDGIRMMKMHNALLLRYSSEFDSLKMSEWWYLIKDSRSDFSQLKSEDKYEITKGLKRNYVEVLDIDKNSDSIYNCYVNAFIRYKNSGTPSTKVKFLNELKNDSKDRNIEYVGVFSKKNKLLVGYSKNYIYKEYVSYSTVKLYPEYMKDGTSAALFQYMNERYLDNQGKKYVSDGERSIRHETNIQKYLQKYFGFRKAFCQLNIKYNSWIKILIAALYPLKNVLSCINSIFSKKILFDLIALLEQERIRRTFHKLQAN